MATAEELIDQLKNFRTRPAAKNALLEMGEVAVGPLIQALDSRYDSVRWTAVSILGELGARDAVPPLVERLKDPDVHSAAADALHHITGENFGDDYDAWKRWIEVSGEPGAAPQPVPEGPSDADLIRDAVYGSDVSASEDPRGYVLRVPLENRHQDVIVNLEAKDSEGVPLVVAYTRCGPANPKHFEWALRQNVKMSAGAIAVVDIDGKPQFVIVEVLLRRGVTSTMLIEAVRRIAEKGDRLEAALTKADEY